MDTLQSSLSPQMVAMLEQLALLCGITYGVTEALGKAVPWLKKIPQDTLAVMIGPLVGMSGFYMGLIQTFSEGATGPRAWVEAAAMGFMGTIGAGMIHDKLANPVIPSRVKERMSEPVKPPATPPAAPPETPPLDPPTIP